MLDLSKLDELAETVESAIISAGFVNHVIGGDVFADCVAVMINGNLTDDELKLIAFETSQQLRAGVKYGRHKEHGAIIIDHDGVIIDNNTQQIVNDVQRRHVNMAEQMIKRHRSTMPVVKHDEKPAGNAVVGKYDAMYVEAQSGVERGYAIGAF